MNFTKLNLGVPRMPYRVVRRASRLAFSLFFWTLKPFRIMCVARRRRASFSLMFASCRTLLVACHRPHRPMLAHRRPATRRTLLSACCPPTATRCSEPAALGRDSRASV